MTLVCENVGFCEECGRGERIRTSGPCLPKTVLYQAELLPDRSPESEDPARQEGAYRERLPGWQAGNRMAGAGNSDGALAFRFFPRSGDLWSGSGLLAVGVAVNVVAKFALTGVLEFGGVAGASS